MRQTRLVIAGMVFATVGIGTIGLRGVQVAMADTADDPLADLLALGEAVAAVDEEGGGSIRAKRDVDMTAENRKRAPENVEGRVEEVNTKQFPLAAVVVKVTKPARKGAGKSVQRNTTLVLVPALKVEGSQVSLKDDQTLINAGAYYLQKGDRVVFRLGERKNNVWLADYIERR